MLKCHEFEKKILRYDHFRERLREEDAGREVRCNLGKLASIELDELKCFVEKKIFNVNSVEFVRNGNFHVCEINDSYIIRIRRLHGKYYLQSRQNAFEQIVKLN